MKRTKIIILLVIAIMAFVAYQYVYQDHRDISSEAAMFSKTSQSISEEFNLNSSNAESKYLNQTIEIHGKITELNTNDLTIDDKIFCQLSTQNTQLKINQSVTIKGRVIGYDNLLEQVKMDQCHVSN